MTYVGNVGNFILGNGRGNLVHFVGNLLGGRGSIGKVVLDAKVLRGS